MGESQALVTQTVTKQLGLGPPRVSTDKENKS